MRYTNLLFTYFLTYFPDQQSPVSRQRCELQLYRPRNQIRKPNTIYRMMPFSMTLNVPNPDFKGTPYPTLNISETVQDRHTTGILNLHTHPPQFQMTLSGLAKFLTIPSVARPLCDSWESCSVLLKRYQTQQSKQTPLRLSLGLGKLRAYAAKSTTTAYVVGHWRVTPAQAT